MRVGVKCVRGNIPDAECRRCAMDALHPCMLPGDLLELMRSDDEPSGTAHSPSRIQGCARQAVLQESHDWFMDIEHQYPMTRGNMVHALMEKATYPGALAVVREKRLTTCIETKFGKQTFTGKPDLVVLKRFDGDRFIAKVVDYKSKNAIGHDLVAAAIEHQIQVNLYAWLVERELTHEGYPVVVDELEIVYADMSKVRRFTSEGYLTAPGKMVKRSPRQYETLDLAPIKLKDATWAEGFVRSRIERRVAAFEELPPVLPSEEAWKCHRCPVFAVCTQVARTRGEQEPG